MATVGLHGPVYIDAALLERAKQEMERLGMRHALGDTIGAVETIGYLLLQANDARPLGEILGATENVGSTTRDKPAPFLPPPFSE